MTLFSQRGRAGAVPSAELWGQAVQGGVLTARMGSRLLQQTGLTPPVPVEADSRGRFSISLSGLCRRRLVTWGSPQALGLRGSAQVLRDEAAVWN